jgi:tetratricopeptide (TPR) repeat protein
LALPARSNDRSQSKFHHIELDVEERPSVDNPSSKLVDFVVAGESDEPPQEAQGDDVKAEPESPANVRDPHELEEIEAGIAKFKRAVQVNPKNAYAWDALGTLYKSAGLYKDAILAYQQATSINPPKALYFHNLGLVYACEGRDEDAIGAFQRVVEIDPDYSLAHATLGGYYRKLGLEELAQKHIGKAMKNIYDSENEYNRACLEAICGNTDHAIELLGVALKNKQTYVDWILRDPDLDFIRQDPRFKQLVSDYAR